MTPAAYNAAQAGALWEVEDLPAELRLAAKAHGPGSDAFAAAVLSWQRWLRLAPDGKLGPATLAAIRTADVLLGIDVSAWQPARKLDWPALHRSGVRYAWIKATQDEGYTSRAFADQAEDAAAAGVLVGAYHFAVPERGDSPEREADRLADACERCDLALLPALDFEEARQGKGPTGPRLTPAELVSWAERAATRLSERLGQWPVFYSYQSFLGYMRPALHDDSPLLSCSLWAAKYGATGPKVDPWPRWAVWQYTSSARIPGYAGRLDANRLVGGRAALDSLRWAGGQCA